VPALPSASEPREVCPAVLVPLAPGELIDKITILEIKQCRIADPHKLDHVCRELALLRSARDQGVPLCQELTQLTARLHAVNASLWQIEDDIRLCERAGDFGSRFIALARSVYLCNDERAALKQQINALLQAPFQEQKSYPAYATRALPPASFLGVETSTR